MLKNALLLVLAFLTITLTVVLAHVENQKYALELGMCKPNSVEATPCLQEVQTRTAWYWHVLFAVLFTYSDLSEKYSSDEGTWEGFVYPNKSNLVNFHSVGTFSSLEECRLQSQSKLTTIGANATGDYECGLDCQINNPQLPKLCKKTKK